MAKPMVRQLASYQVRPDAVDRVLAAIREFVVYVKANEPGTLRYEAWQEKGARRGSRTCSCFLTPTRSARTRSRPR